MKLGSSFDFGQEAIAGLAAEGLPDVAVPAVPEALPPDALPAAPVATTNDRQTAPRSKASLMPSADLRTIYENVSRETQVPVNVLIAMGYTESGHRADVDGPETKWGKAGGIMQYLEDTARRRGINRYNPEEAIRAAAEDMRDQVAKNGGNWADAIKHHHAGPNREQWGKKTEAYSRKILARAREVAGLYDQELAATSEQREGEREQAAAAKRGEYYDDPKTAAIANPKTGGKPAPAPAGRQSEAGLGGVFGFGDQLRQAVEAAPHGDLGVMNGLDGQPAPKVGRKSFTPATEQGAAEVRSMLAAGTEAQRKTLLADTGWRGQLARTLWAESEQAKKLTQASGITPGIGQNKPIQTRDEIEASYRQSGYNPAQAAMLAQQDLAGHTDTMKASTFDFDEQARQQQRNTGARALTRGANAFRQAGYGLVLAGAEAAGADELARGAAINLRQINQDNQLVGQNRDSFMRPIEDAATSVMQQLPGLAAGLATGGGATLALMGVQSFGQNYGEARASKGMTAGEAAAYAAPMAAFEILGEKFGLGATLNVFKKAAGMVGVEQAKQLAVRELAKEAQQKGIMDKVSRDLAQMLGGDVFGEQVTYAGQTGVQQALDKTAQPMTAERYFEGAIDTLGQTLIQSVMMGGGLTAAGAVASRLTGNADAGAGTVPGAADYASAANAAFARQPSGPIARAVEKSAPVAATAAPAGGFDWGPPDGDMYQPADEVLDRPPVDEAMYLTPEPDAAGDVPASQPPAISWGAEPGAAVGAAPVEVGRKENFAEDYPTPPAPDADAIADTDARVQAAQAQQSAAARRELLTQTLSDDSVQNPAAKFAANLRRAGFRDTSPSAEEQATIDRFTAARDTFATHDPASADQLPAAPNELAQDGAADWRAQRDAEIMGDDGTGLAKPAPAASQQAEPAAARLTPEQAAIAEQSRAANQFIKLLKKAGLPVTNERELVNAWKEYKTNGQSGDAGSAGHRLAGTQQAGDAAGAGSNGPAAAPDTAAQAVATGGQQRGGKGVSADAVAGKRAASLKKPYHKRLKEIDIARHSVRDAVAKLGGIRKDEALREWGNTLVEGVRSRFVGAPIFRSKGGSGMALDKMREALAELGYLAPDSDINDLYDAFQNDALHPVGHEQRAAAEASQRDREFVPQSTGAAAERTLDNHPAYDPALDGPEWSGPAWQPPVLLPDELNEAAADNAANLSDDEADAFTELLAALHAAYGEDATADMVERAGIMADSGQDFYQSLGELINEQQSTAAGTGQGKGTVAGEPEQGRARTAQDDEQGQRQDDGAILQSYDQAELERREQAQRDAEAQRKAEEQAADRKRQADAEVGDFTLTGSDSEADQLAARGQGGLFDAPPAAPKSKAYQEPKASPVLESRAEGRESSTSDQEQTRQPYPGKTELQQRKAFGKALSYTGYEGLDGRRKALRQRSEQMGEDGNYPESEKQANQAYDDFYSRVIDADEFQARLDRIEESKKDPLNHGAWVALGDGSQQWRFQGMNFARIEDVRRTDGASQNTSRPWRTSDGEYFENQREAKRHELATTATQNLQRDGYLPKPKQATVSENKIFTEDAAAKARALLKSKLSQLNSGIDPEIMQAGITLAGYHIEKGARTFAAYAKAMIEDMGEGVKPYLKSWYMGVKYDPRAASFTDMSAAADVDAANIDDITKDTNDAPATSGSVEQDRGQPGAATASQRTADGDGSAAAGRRAGAAGAGATRGRQAGGGDQRVSGADDAAGGKRSDQPVHQPDGQLGTAPGAAGRGQRRGGAAAGGQRLPADAERSADPVSAAAGVATERVAREKAQNNAPATFIAGDLDNIRDTLPALLPEQQDDVLKAEQRFASDDGHGMMFTNGTGTGKTYTGTGIAKRFILQGKTNILAVAPSQDILKGWQAAMKALGIEATVLSSTSENGGSGMVLTTYANLGANQTLAERQWDLVITDESHKLMQSEDGSNTSALSTLRAITHHPAALSAKARMILRDKISKMNALADDAKVNRNSDNDQLWGLAAEQQAKADALAREIEDRTKELVAEYQQQPRSKVIFLSATPFSYHFTLDYGNGYLFDYNEGQSDDSQEFRSYNSGGNRERFFMQHFGYRMRYNKLTRPKSGVNSELMEREFHEKLRRDGSLSGRKLTVAADYDRKFVLVDSGIGQRIDEALKFLSDTKDEEDRYKYRELHAYTIKKFDYLSRMRLLEAIKAEHAVAEIKQHHALGRKVVVFHDYNSGGGFSPFNYDALTGSDIEDYQSDDEDLQATAAVARQQSAAANAMLADAYTGKQIREQIAMLKAERPDILQIDFSKMKSPLATLTAAFPNALVYNGTVPGKDRARARELFNQDGSGHDLIVVQSAAGEAGISLHDTTGQHQRVLLNLGMPIRPVTAIQQEGRIYRVGQVTDAVMRYMTTGTGWEDAAFASKIAGRAGTAENLGMGNEARALRQSFIDAYTNASEFPASAEDGKGGKEQDYAENSAMSPFARSKTYYYAQQKNAKRRDQREGKDYFATPEPIGFKMVEFANVRPFERVLEPSAGHGAIARFLPENAARTLVEPAGTLAPKAAMAAPGAKLVQSDFESLHLANKYDAIVMNPPYGSGGSTAIAHVAKAAKHLRNGGRIVALIPRGGMADKRFDSWLYGDEATDIYLQADIALPRSTFENAGTGVATRIVVLDKQTQPDDVAKLRPQTSRDYSDAASIEALFDRIEQAQLPERIEPTVSDGMSLEEGDTVAIGGIDFDVLHGGKSLRPKGKLGKDEFAQAAALARQYGGSYDSYDKAFFFASAEKRSQWAEAYDRGDEPTDKPTTQQATVTADSNAKSAEAADALQSMGLAEVMHKTGKGKELIGYVVDMPINLVKDSIDKYAFRKEGGVFVRKDHAEKLLGQLLATSKASIVGSSTVRVSGGRSVTVPDLNRIVSRVASGWHDIPKIFTVQQFVDLPADVQQAAYKSGGNEGSQGMLLLQAGEVYVIAENHDDALDVEKTLFHEIVGHYALRRMTGANREAQDTKIRELFHAVGGRMEVMDFANRHGFYKELAAYEEKFKHLKYRPEQIETLLFDEMFAHYAETRPSGFRQALKELAGLVRQWLRNHGWKELATLNDNDLAFMLRQARNQIQTSRAVTSEWQAYSATATMAPGPELTVADMRAAIARHPLAEWVRQLEQAGRLVLRPRLTLPDSHKHMEKRIQAFASQGNITAFAANIPGAEHVMPVLLHETFHASVEPLIGSQKWNALLDELDAIYQHAQDNPNGKAGAMWRKAKARIDGALNQGIEISGRLLPEELGAYAIEEAERAPATWQRWVQRFLGHVKAWARRVFGAQLGQLTPEQLRAMAIAALKDGNIQPGGESRAKMSVVEDREQDAISMSKGNFPGADGKEVNIALGRDAQRRLQQENPSWHQRLRDMGLKGLRPTLATLPGNTVVDLYADKLPALATAQKMSERLDGLRQSMQKDADETFRKWQALPAAEADKMADLMHEATIWQLHPDQVAPDNLNPKWAAKHRQLTKEWAALPPAAQAVYREVRDLYAKRTEQMYDALASRIDRIKGIGTGARSKMLADLRERFDKTLGEGPYFPLSRFGEFLVVAKRLDDEGKTLDKIVLAAETEHEQTLLADDLRARGFDVVERDKAAKNFRASSMGADLSGFAATIIDRLDGVEMSDEQRNGLLDDINQMLIDALPPASARKHFKHRKGVAGFSNDAVRAFVRSQSSMASHIANLSYQDRIDDALIEARKQAKTDQANVNELALVVDEMEARADLARSFVASPLANALTTLGFANFLGFSISQGLLNLTQVPVMTYPALAAKFGEGVTDKALASAYAKVGRALTKKDGETWGDLRTLPDLDADSKRVLAAMEARGKLDLTMALDLARAGGGPQAPGRNMAVRGAQWVGRYMGWFNHISEAANRQITAVAAYRLALDSGMSSQQAIDYTAKLLDDTQFNYAFSNRPRILMSNTGRVLGMMHTFGINAMYRIGRNLFHAVGDWKGEEGKQARGVMFRMLAVQTALAGASGLPLLPIAAAVTGVMAKKLTGSRTVAAFGAAGGAVLMQALLAGMLADEDEPFDWDVERRQLLNEVTGDKTVAELLDKGLIRALGVDVANRISMSDLLYRDFDTGFTTKPAQTWLDNAFTQFVGGAAYGAVKQYARAVDYAADGQYHRAVEASLPKFAADVLKASRYAREDVRVTVGGSSAHKADASAVDVARQAMGFTPAKVAEINTAERTQRNTAQALQERRSSLMAEWLAAKTEGNREAEEKAMQAIRKFSATQRAAGNDELAISPRELTSKWRSQGKAVNRRERGSIVARRYQGAAGDAAEAYNVE